MNSLSSPQQIDQAFVYILGVSVVILIGITLTMIYFVFRYGQKRHPHPEDIRGNWKLELVWTVVPTIIALSMFYFGWSSYMGLRNVPEGAMEIETTAEMYAWGFLYENGKESYDELVVPLNKAIKLNITSLDVVHSLFIPAFRVKVDAVNGMQTYVWFYADKLGEFEILCAEFCGTGHSDMTGVLRIVSEEEYQQWLLTKSDDDDDDDFFGDDSGAGLDGNKESHHVD